MSMHFKNGRREGVGMVVGWAKAKLRSREGRSREKRKGDREKEGKKNNKKQGNDIRQHSMLY